MSRIGKKPVILPLGVQMNIIERTCTVRGPKGELSLLLHDHVRVEIGEGQALVTVVSPQEKRDRSLWGLFQRLLQNMVLGVTIGFEKKLEVNGVGFKVALFEKTLTLHLGFSHPVEFKIPEEIEVIIEKNIITLRGIDKHLVGEIAAQLRSLKKPEPYKGKGIKYSTEVIRRKAGKAGKAGSK